MIGRFLFAAVLLISTDLCAYGSHLPIRSCGRYSDYKEPEVYPRPGAISLKDNNKRWEGSDHLLDLPESVRVVTEVVADPSQQIWLPKQDVQWELETDLKTAGIAIRAPAGVPDDPYRPFLHLLIDVMAFDTGYAVHMSLRLFERTDAFSRGKMRKGESWQVITWERQAYFFAPLGHLINDARCHARQLSHQFTGRKLLEKREDKVSSRCRQCDPCSRLREANLLKKRS